MVGPHVDQMGFPMGPTIFSRDNAGPPMDISGPPMDISDFTMDQKGSPID